jgi:NAD/NADP transhydrogenase beta subunit
MDTQQVLIDSIVILILFVGISQFRTPKGARAGNLTAAAALFCALGVVIYRNSITDLPLVVSSVLIGGGVGWIVAMRVNMIQIPSMVAFQHGVGGVAVFLVSFVELTTDAGDPLTITGEVSGILGLSIGAATFSASMIASGKLANRLKQTPTVLSWHNSILVSLIVVIAVLGVFAATELNKAVLGYYLVLSIFVSMALGILFSIRIGGADMPVLISFLNATAGVAAAFCGVVIENRLLIACGATVAASGSVLTFIMCQAMNRDLFRVLSGIHLEERIVTHPGVNEAERQESLGFAGTAAAPEMDREPCGQDPYERAIEAATNAKTIVIVPGYGMALSEAEFEVVRLGDKLDELGKDIRFAVHPVAGRMPGHMHVLLAEAEVDYDKLFEIDDINPEFDKTDLVIVVGACDVVNSAALENAETPISGMPILLVHEANCIVVCNLDENPGYSGVDNPLYTNPKTILLMGDAKISVGRLLAGIAIEKSTLIPNSQCDLIAD